MPSITNTLAGRWIRRYKFFFLIGFLIFLIQLLLAYNSFKLPLYSGSGSNNNISPKYNQPFSKNTKKIDELISIVGGGIVGGGININGNLPIDDEEDSHNSNSNLYGKINNNQSGVQQQPPNQKKRKETPVISSSSVATATQQQLLKLDEINFIPKCDINVREAISAIYRAKTNECKEHIADITCDIINNKFYPKILPNFCPNHDLSNNRALGCYKDEKNYRILSGYYTNFKTSNSPGKCIQMCLQSGFLYAGVQYSTECFCGNDEPSTSIKLADSSCNMKCSGNPKQACGGYFTINVFATGVSKFVPQVAETIRKPTDPSVQIVYLLTLNGRAVRQVHRLIKALYNRNNFYFIHVDSRQDYMYRTLLSLESKYSNIRLARKRYSTIWGGASLLTMLLESMKVIRTFYDWDWDFIINLSESDFPIKTNEKLIDFLTANRHKNFVKSHGREVQRFIQKQGLDKTFVECDTHMWRIGDRQLPYGIQIDGGSDWIALSRPFVDYVVSEESDDLIDGLLVIFRHTLLPAESFFHTLLRNSGFCNTYIDNNLHVTNWKRRLGCKCQYKHVVDWCGCSPNDFKLIDYQRLMLTEKKQIFFGRKFESIINQKILLKLEEWMYGPYPSEYVNLNKYWQSLYHHEDNNSAVDDAFMTIITSLIRLNSRKVKEFEFKSLLEVTTYMDNDNYEGFLIKYSTMETDGEIEVLVKPKQIASVLMKSELGKRIKLIEVGSEYDQKEQTLRNYGKFLGPMSDPVLVFHLKNTDNHTLNYNITVLWIDPIGDIAAVDDYHVEDGTAGGGTLTTVSINFIKSTIKQPLMPGSWTVKLIHKKILIGETNFLITPIEISNNYAKDKINLGVGGYNLNVTLINYLLKVSVTDEEERKEKKRNFQSNSKRIGLDLQQWIDSLVKEFYFIKRSCGMGLFDERNNLDECEDTDWSSMAPDPKSDVDSLNEH